MKTTYKLILKTYLGPMVLTFFIVMFILLMHFLWMRIDELVGKGLSTGVIFELIMYAMATLIPMALPLATLLASIMTMGDLGENNELLALKSAGVSLPRIMKPLIILMVGVCTASFFIINNLTPYAYQQMFTLLSDISRQRQEMKIEPGRFFNGIPDMSIKPEYQDPVTGRYDNLLIYNTSERGKMHTTIADSGYIKISEDRKYLEVTLFNGKLFEQNRNAEWYRNSSLSRHAFERQDMLIALSGFAFERSDMDMFSSNSQTKNLSELKVTTDSLKYVQDSLINQFAKNLMGGQLFRQYRNYKALDSIPTDMKGRYIASLVDTMSTNSRSQVYYQASSWATEAKNSVQYNVELTNTAYHLYRAQINQQQKFTLPFSILIFFLIGAPLGAIIRKGGLGMPIVISVLFFVFHYIISIAGEKLVKDGALPAYIGMWLSSLVLFPIAMFLTYKSTNDSSLLNAEVYRTKFKRVAELARSTVNKLNKKINDRQHIEQD